jgi:hypothetical protein
VQALIHSAFSRMKSPLRRSAVEIDMGRVAVLAVEDLPQ